MARQISLFSGYSSGENRTTNYAMLLVRLLYEESPELYEQFLGSLLQEPIDALPIFAQQQRQSTSIPDAVIRQHPYTVFFETKKFDWFYDEQLHRHLDNLEHAGEGIKALIALSAFDSGEQYDLNRRLEPEIVKRAGLKFRALSFREFLDCIPPLSEETFLARARREFEQYLRDEGLLGTWEEWLDVVNCSKWPEHFIDHSVYSCPLTSSAYRHTKCKYLGLYKNKQVSHVALIRGVVELPCNGTASVKWSNDQTSDEELISLARQRVTDAWGAAPDEDRRIFVLGSPFPTSFQKTTKGGMMGSKQYFFIGNLRPPVRDAEDLATRLRGNPWEYLG
jgi:hypothetical protein